MTKKNVCDDKNIKRTCSRYGKSSVQCKKIIKKCS